MSTQLPNLTTNESQSVQINFNTKLYCVTVMSTACAEEQNKKLQVPCTTKAGSYSETWGKKMTIRSDASRRKKMVTFTEDQGCLPI